MPAISNYEIINKLESIENSTLIEWIFNLDVVTVKNNDYLIN